MAQSVSRVGGRAIEPIKDLSALKSQLEHLSESLDSEEKSLLAARVSALVSVYPFNEFEYSLMFLLSRSAITFTEYESIRQSYVSTNPFLHLFELSPRVFGEIWGHEHVIDLDSRFRKASKSVDAMYAGQYDLWLEGIRVEVKAARAINTRKRGGLISKALRYDSLEGFWMNYQQLKLDACDVFIFIGVWIDEIRYWVLSTRHVEQNKYRSHQHRGGVEYQIGITNKNIADFDSYLASGNLVGDAVINRFNEST